jgi:hypothetical protein
MNYLTIIDTSELKYDYTKNIPSQEVLPTYTYQYLPSQIQNNVQRNDKESQISQGHIEIYSKEIQRDYCTSKGIMAGIATFSILEIVRFLLF